MSYKFLSNAKERHADAIMLIAAMLEHHNTTKFCLANDGNGLQVLTTFQLATIIVQAYPAASDMLAFVNHIALELGEPPQNELLNPQVAPRRAFHLLMPEPAGCLGPSPHACSPSMTACKALSSCHPLHTCTRDMTADVREGRVPSVSCPLWLCGRDHTGTQAPAQACSAMGTRKTQSWLAVLTPCHQPIDSCTGWTSCRLAPAQP